MTKGLKVWLIIVIVLNCVGIIGCITMGLILSAILSAAVVTGAIMLLKIQKMGFYVICIASVIAVIYNLSMHINPGYAIFGFLGPLIIWLLMQKNWGTFN
jgi:hypothetical protein